MPLNFSPDAIVHNYFPGRPECIPFGDMLNELFFNPGPDNQDFPMHGPNAIRFLDALVNCNLMGKDCEIGLLAPGFDGKIYVEKHKEIKNALFGKSGDADRVGELLKFAALFHDIGKTIRRANHPPIGANLLRNYSEQQTASLIMALGDDRNPDEKPESKHNRFSLITSIIQHHDKFGVVSTGEGGLPLFSDILYFTSDQSTIPGIKKNITSVMLANLSDIAAVCTAPQDMREKAKAIVKQVYEIRIKGGSGDENALLEALIDICISANAPAGVRTCLGLDFAKVDSVLEDWDLLIGLVEDRQVQGNRVKLKRQLLDYERNPSRAIKRIQRLLHETSTGSNCPVLVEDGYISPTSVESILVGTLGAHQFQTFCELLATVVKLDYALYFFKAIICATVRKAIERDYVAPKSDDRNAYMLLTNQELAVFKSKGPKAITETARKITTLFVKTLEGLLNRYNGVFGYSAYPSSSTDPRRFGFQMRPLVQDEKIRDSIISMLCEEENKDHIALTWIGDEVSIWSMD